jgi:glycosyltransferase involved in cell wall biosynthesis
MRILLASDFYPPFIGGAERQVQLLGRELARRGHVVSVASIWSAGMAECMHVEDGVAVHRLKGLTTRVPWFFRDPKRRYHPPFPDPSIVIGLRRLIREVRPDVVHAAGWIAYSCAAALFGKDVPLIVSARDYGYSCAIRTLLRNGRVCDGPAPLKCLGCAAQSYGLPKAAVATAGVLGGQSLLRSNLAGVHSISTFVQNVTRRDLLGRQNSKNQPRAGQAIADVVVPSFLEDAGRSSCRARPAYLPSESYILFVGALQAHKGLGLLLESYVRLDSPPPLVLIGSTWPDTPSTFPSNVTVLRDMPHSDVMAAWEHCRFGVAPSVWPEPLGMVVAEAMSMGKAVIGSRIGGIVDTIIDGETGLLVPPGDVDALTAALQKLIASPELCERLGGAARERTRLFRAHAIIPRFEALYEQVIGPPEPSASSMESCQYGR